MGKYIGKYRRRSLWHFDLRSFLIGGIVMLFAAVLMDQAGAIDLPLQKIGNVVGKNFSSSISSLVNIKKNLDSDVKKLTADAKVLIDDKDNLLEIKNQLFKLAQETKNQIDSITKLVSEVENHLKATKTDIQTTAGHVGEIDDVRKALQGK